MMRPNAGMIESWLEDVVNMEKCLIVVNGSLSDLQDVEKRLSKGRITQKALTNPTNYHVQKPDTSIGVVDVFGGMLGVAMLASPFALVGTVAILIYDFVMAVTHGGGPKNGGEYYFNPFTMAFDFTGGNLLLAFLLVFLVIITVVMIGSIPFLIAHYLKENSAKKDEYKQKLKRASVLQANEGARVQQARTDLDLLDQRLTWVRERYDMLSDTRSSIIAALESLYATNYLSYEYRGIVPTAVMLGYLKSGRCTEVYGHGGAIDTYVHDQQIAQINDKLDTIIDMLDDIRYSQGELYRAMVDVQQEQSALRKDINRAAMQQHADTQSLVEIERYNAQVLTYISSIESYRMLSNQ